MNINVLNEWPRKTEITFSITEIIRITKTIIQHSSLSYQ